MIQLDPINLPILRHLIILVSISFFFFLLNPSLFPSEYLIFRSILFEIYLPFFFARFNLFSTKSYFLKKKSDFASIYHIKISPLSAFNRFHPMGCISSREAKRLPYMPVIHGSKRRGDSSHDVSLTFSTLNSLRLDPNQYSFDQEMVKIDGPDPPEQELEKINVRELMEGLDEPLHASLTDPNFSFWMQKDQLDPQVIANFRKTMIELSPQHPNLRPLLSPVKYRPDQIPKFPGIVKARVAAFEEKIDARRRRSFRSIPSLKISSLQKPLSDAKGKLVLFSTSLRGVRKTYEDCCNVKTIIQSYGVWIDERDVSMHGGFRDELSEILGAGSKLPKIFADGRYLGGVEEVERMHEDGELREALKDCEMEKGLKGINGVVCDVCGDYKFFPCEICSGSCKVFLEDEEDEIGGFRRCANCNENGLVRCNLCS